MVGILRLDGCGYPGLPVTHARVLRGGAFDDNSNNARVAARNDNNPNNNWNNNGFRVVCASHLFVPLRWRGVRLLRCEGRRLSNAAALPEMPGGYGFPDAAKI